MQNSIVAQGKHIFIYSICNYWSGNYVPSRLIYHMDVETENWENQIDGGGYYLLKEPSNFFNIYLYLSMTWSYLNIGLYLLLFIFIINSSLNWLSKKLNLTLDLKTLSKNVLRQRAYNIGFQYLQYLPLSTFHFF